MCASDAKDLWESKSFSKWVDGKNQEQKNIVAIASAVGVVVSAINNLIKLTAGKTGRN